MSVCASSEKALTRYGGVERPHRPPPVAAYLRSPRCASFIRSPFLSLHRLPSPLPSPCVRSVCPRLASPMLAETDSTALPAAPLEPSPHTAPPAPAPEHPPALPALPLASAPMPVATAVAVPIPPPDAIVASVVAELDEEAADGEKKRSRKSGTTVPRWSLEEEERMRELVATLGEKQWGRVAEQLGTGRTQSAVEQHWQIMTGKRKRDGRAIDSSEDGADQLKAARAEAKAAKVAQREAKAEAKATEKELKEASKLEKLAVIEKKKSEREAKAAEREKELQVKAAEKEAKKLLPKKPRSSYLIFCKETRQAVVEEFPEMGAVEIVKHQAAEWGKLSDEDKKKYVDEAAADAERYKQECLEAGIHVEGEKSEKRRRKKDSTGETSSGDTPPSTKKRRDSQGKAKPGLLPFVLPEGYQLAPPPPQAALDFGSPEGEELLGKHILYNWRGVGWCEGIIILRNDTKRYTIGGDVINFYVHYQLDDNESAHVLELRAYGGGDEAPFDSWVMLEKVSDDAAAPAAAPADASHADAE